MIDKIDKIDQIEKPKFFKPEDLGICNFCKCSQATITVDVGNATKVACKKCSEENPKIKNSSTKICRAKDLYE